jgi:hypothetical protein
MDSSKKQNIQYLPSTGQYNLTTGNGMNGGASADFGNGKKSE